MVSFLAGLIYLSGDQGLFLVKSQKKQKNRVDLKFLEFLFDFLKKRNRIFKLSTNFLTLNTKIFARWEFIRKDIMGVSVLNSSNISKLSTQILNEIGKLGFRGIFQHQLARKLNLKPSYIHHHLISLTSLKLLKKIFCLNQKNSKISNPILLMVNYFHATGIIKEKKDLSFKVFSKQNELGYFKKLVNIIVRQERDIGQKNLKYGILFQKEIFKKNDKRKIHRVWQKLRERLIKSNVLFEKRSEKKKSIKILKVFTNVFLDFKKKTNFTIFFSLKNFSPNDCEIKFLFYISPWIQIQKIIQKKSLVGVNFPFLIDNLRGHVNYKTLHSIIKNLEFSRGIIRKFKQIGRQRILNFRVDILKKFKLLNFNEEVKKFPQNETDQVTKRRLLLISWLDSHVLVLKDLGRKLAFFEKKGLTRVDSKVVRRILSDLIKLGYLKVLKIQIQLNFWKTKEIEFVTKKNFDSLQIKKISEYMFLKKICTKIPPQFLLKKPKKSIKLKKKDKLTLFPRSFSFCLERQDFNISKEGTPNCFFFWKKKSKDWKQVWKTRHPLSLYYSEKNAFLKNRFFISTQGKRNPRWFKKHKQSPRENKGQKKKKEKKIPRNTEANFFIKEKYCFLEKFGKNWAKKSLSKNGLPLSLCSIARQFFPNFFPQKIPNGTSPKSRFPFFLKKTLVRKFNPFPFMKTYFFFKKKKKKEIKNLANVYFRKKRTKTIISLDYSLFQTSFLDKWDCESDVKLFQFHLFDDPRNPTSQKPWSGIKVTPFFRRLKGILKVGNTKRVKLYSKKCSRFSWSPFLKFQSYSFLDLTKRALEFPSNYFCFDLEKVSISYQEQKKEKKKKKRPLKKSFFENFSLKASTSPTFFLFPYYLSTVTMVFEKVFFFYDFLVPLAKSPYFFWETFFFSFFQSAFKNSPFNLFMVSFTNLLKFIKCLPGYTLRKTSQREVNVLKFLGEMKKRLLFKNLEENKLIFSPLLLKCNFNINSNSYNGKENKTEKIANIVELRIQKKNLLYTEINPRGKKRSPIFFRKKQDALWQKKKTTNVQARNQVQKHGKPLKNFLFFALKFLNNNLSKKKPFFLTQKIRLVIFSIQFFSKKLQFQSGLFLKQNPLGNNVDVVNKFSQEQMRDARFLKWVVFTKIITTPGKEKKFLEIFLKIPPFGFLSFDKTVNLLLMERKIYGEHYFMKSWKFSFFSLKTMSLSIWNPTLKKQSRYEKLFPFF